MTDTRKVLFQNAPTATTLTDAYTVSTTSATVYTVTVANTSGSSDTFRLSIAPGGASNDISQYIFYGFTVAANSTYHRAVDQTLLANSDVIRIYSTGGNLSFTVTGIETT